MAVPCAGRRTGAPRAFGKGAAGRRRSVIRSLLATGSSAEGMPVPGSEDGSMPAFGVEDGSMSAPGLDDGSVQAPG